MALHVNNFDITSSFSILLKAIDIAGVGILITDPKQEDNPIIYANKGFEELSLYQPSEVIGYNCRFLQGDGKHNDRERKQIRTAIEKEEVIQTCLINYKKDGTPFWNELSISPVLIEELNQIFFVSILKDVTKEMEAKLIVDEQNEVIEALSTPIIPVLNHVAVIPLIGDLDDSVKISY